MALLAFQELFAKSNAPDFTSPATDPLESIGGIAPVGEVGGNWETGSIMYRPANTDPPHLSGQTIITDAQADGVQSTDPVAGDYLYVTIGPDGGQFAKVLAVNNGTGAITIDRPLKNQTAVQFNIRTSRRDLFFDPPTEEQMVDGLVDYRMLYFIHNDDNDDFGFKFFIEPIQANGVQFEIQVPQRPINVTAGNSGTHPNIYLPPDRFTDPFDERGVIVDNSGTPAGQYNNIDARKLATQIGNGVPNRGMTDAAGGDIDQWLPVWVKRTIPKGAGGGECIFRFGVYVDDATTQDPGADPVPYESGFIFGWLNPQPTYTATIETDRIIYERGGARITATIVDSRGVPAENVNAYFELTGDGSIITDRSQRTDSAGQIRTTYTSPASVPVSDPIIRVVIPENTET